MFPSTATGLEPYITSDAVITKQVRGLPGDEIRIARDKLYINGLFSGNLNLLTRLQKPSGAYDQTYRVPANHIFVLGSHPRSYDSRYWGVLHVREVFARARRFSFKWAVGLLALSPVAGPETAGVITTPRQRGGSGIKTPRKRREWPRSRRPPSSRTAGLFDLLDARQYGPTAG
jgi:hypothetical protein